MPDLTIWKFPVGLLDEHGMVTSRPVIGMPTGARIIALQVQELTPTMWAIVNPGEPLVDRRFAIVGTGQPMPAAKTIPEYVGTWQSTGFVFHVFELLGKEGSDR